MLPKIRAAYHNFVELLKVIKKQIKINEITKSNQITSINFQDLIISNLQTKVAVNMFLNEGENINDKSTHCPTFNNYAEAQNYIESITKKLVDQEYVFDNPDFLIKKFNINNTTSILVNNDPHVTKYNLPLILSKLCLADKQRVKYKKGKIEKIMDFNLHNLYKVKNIKDHYFSNVDDAIKYLLVEIDSKTELNK